TRSRASNAPRTMCSSTRCRRIIMARSSRRSCASWMRGGANKHARLLPPPGGPWRGEVDHCRGATVVGWGGLGAVGLFESPHPGSLREPTLPLQGRVRRGSAMPDRLKDKVALVAGAGSIGPGWGNGKATAVTFAREGAKVFCADVNLAAAEETAAII